MKHFQTLLEMGNKTLLPLLCLLWMLGCAPKDKTPLNTLTLRFAAKVDGKPIVFDEKYTTPRKQEVSFERMKLYISHVKLYDQNTQQVFVEADSYHLLSFGRDMVTDSLVIDRVPSHFVVNKIELSIGVDKEKNHRIDQMGDLDPGSGMAWTWKTGYRFLLIEGMYYPVDQDPKGLVIHIGTDKNYFTNTFDTHLSMASLRPVVDFSVNAMAPIGSLDLSQNSSFKMGAAADRVAQQYKNTLLTLVPR